MLKILGYLILYAIFTPIWLIILFIKYVILYAIFVPMCMVNYIIYKIYKIFN